ncbi:DUF6223 family protein [Streptomyces boluensis]|uniref:Uncharacterized protein n=1 Tax=Streptomyces boluensis TaxID=1775135 RepID=A0A964UMU3_9ACTN|nr:DUF6223 family protein [Streptomyces boluensis]NBE50668.1 hypothetical protein [Streptomyces boluensis]
MPVPHLLAADIYTFSSGRIGAVVAALLGLTGIVIGGLALARATGRITTGPGRRGAALALAAGAVAVALGTVVATTASGGLGTGNGLGGAYVAVIVGVIGGVLGGSAWARTRRGESVAVSVNRD